MDSHVDMLLHSVCAILLNLQEFGAKTFWFNSLQPKPYLRRAKPQRTFLVTLVPAMCQKVILKDGGRHEHCEPWLQFMPGGLATISVERHLFHITVQFLLMCRRPYIFRHAVGRPPNGPTRKRVGAVKIRSTFP